MIEGTQARSRTLEESNRGADDVLEANRIVAKVFSDGTRVSVGEPEADEHILAAGVAIQAIQ